MRWSYQHRYDGRMKRETRSASRLSEAIAQARSRAGLSLRELAERCGVHHATIHGIEQGRLPRPRWADVVAIARVLELPLEDLATQAAQERRAG